jgi:hypothetical protein
VPDEYLKAAIALLAPMQLRGLHTEAWKMLKAEAERRRHKPPAPVRMARHMFDGLPPAVQNLLKGHS